MYNWDGGSTFKDKPWGEHLPTDSAVCDSLCCTVFLYFCDKKNKNNFILELSQCIKIKIMLIIGVSWKPPYYGIYHDHIGYQYTLLRDFDTECRKSVCWYLVYMYYL